MAKTRIIRLKKPSRNREGKNITAGAFGDVSWSQREVKDSMVGKQQTVCGCLTD